MTEFSTDPGTLSDSGDSESSQLLEFSVETKNKFENGGLRGNRWTRVERGSKRKKLSSGSISNEHFSQLSTTDKLVNMFESINTNTRMLTSLQSQQTQCLSDIRYLNEGVVKTSFRLSNVEKCIDQQGKKLKMLAYKSLDLEARSRRNNLVFWGITENMNKDCMSLVYSFLEDELDLDRTFFSIERAHRLGRKQTIGNRGNTYKRPLIVRFRDYTDTDYVLESAFKLKGTPFAVDRDYPREIVDARKALHQSQEAREAREKRLKVQIRYPARLYIQDRLIRDMFPDWFSVLKESRIEGFDREDFSVGRENPGIVIENVNNQSAYSTATAIDDQNSPIPNSVFTSPVNRHTPFPNVNKTGEIPRDTTFATKVKQQLYTGTDKTFTVQMQSHSPAPKTPTSTRMSRNKNTSPNINSKKNDKPQQCRNTLQPRSSSTPITQTHGSKNRQREITPGKRDDSPDRTWTRVQRSCW